MFYSNVTCWRLVTLWKMNSFICIWQKMQNSYSAAQPFTSFVLSTKLRTWRKGAMCGTLGYYKRGHFHWQTVSQFSVFSVKVYMSAKFFKICHPQKFTPVKLFKTGHPQNLNVRKMLKIFPNVAGTSYVKISESQVL